MPYASKDPPASTLRCLIFDSDKRINYYISSRIDTVVFKMDMKRHKIDSKYSKLLNLISRDTVSENLGHY